MKPPKDITARTRERAAHICECAASYDGDPGYENIAEFLGYDGDYSPEVLLAYAAWFHQCHRLRPRAEGQFVDWRAFEAEVAEFLRDGGVPDRKGWDEVTKSEAP